MSYSGAAVAAQSRELLGASLERLQQEANLPEDVLAVVQHIAQAVGALFEAERASSDVDGRASVRHAMGFLSQTMALLQDVKSKHAGIATATQSLAEVMGKLYPLGQATSMRPPSSAAQKAASVPPTTARVPPTTARVPPTPRVPPEAQAPRSTIPGAREHLEANVGATTESNFFVGFSGDISEGGVFVATYLTLDLGAKVDALVTLPGGFQQRIPGTVRFVRDPMDMESEPGIGVKFDRLDHEARELILRFIRKRPPLFYDE